MSNRKRERTGTTSKGTRSNRQTLNEELKTRSAGQTEYIRTMVENTITFGIGPAGSGKSYCALGLAAQYLNEGKVQRIIVTRPHVEAAPKSLGALPGGIDEKVAPYLVPAVEHLKLFLGVDRYYNLRDKGEIVIEPLEFMRGRTFKHTFIVGEEFQNATTEQIKMFMTRIGDGSKMVIDGDIEQTDMKKTNSQFSTDLEFAIYKVKDIEGIGLYELQECDIVRHPLIGKIVKAFR